MTADARGSGLFSCLTGSTVGYRSWGWGPWRAAGWGGLRGGRRRAAPRAAGAGWWSGSAGRGRRVDPGTGCVEAWTAAPERARPGRPSQPLPTAPPATPPPTGGTTEHFLNLNSYLKEQFFKMSCSPNNSQIQVFLFCCSRSVYPRFHVQGVLTNSDGNVSKNALISL